MNEWRSHPKLINKFLPDYPDDLQALIHEGGPRLSDKLPELVWVRITELNENIFNAVLLNKPEQLNSIKQNSILKFIIPNNGSYPIMITNKYYNEKSNWRIHPCDKCGFTELFDAPSDLIKIIFPNIPDGSIMEKFTSFCGLCGGIQVIENKELKEKNEFKKDKQKKWWKIW